MSDHGGWSGVGFLLNIGLEAVVLVIHSFVIFLVVAVTRCYHYLHSDALHAGCKYCTNVPGQDY